MKPKHTQVFTDYTQAVQAHDVAISLKWIARIRHDDGKWIVEYIGKCS